MVGLWLLAPEHLRLGTWELLCRWSQKPGQYVDPRLGFQMIHEAALCVTGIREARSLSQKGFEVLNGLPFVGSDQAIHKLLDSKTVAESEALQVELGMIRRARGHYSGNILAVDPHRTRSYSKRQMCRFSGNTTSKPTKAAQTFFCLDVETKQPLCFTCGTSAISVTQATPPLLRMCTDILNPKKGTILIVADAEHYTARLIDHVAQRTPFDLLVPMQQQKSYKKRVQSLPSKTFIPRWAGFATAKLPYKLKRSRSGSHIEFIQRMGENPDEYEFKSFLCTCDREEVSDLTENYPKRWHIEEFFNTNQALGWRRAGTMNLNIRFGQMTMALIAQAAIHQLRQRLGEPYCSWNAEHLARAVFNGIDGDIRVKDDTIIVTLYNAPNVDLLKSHYENLPEKLCSENINPKLPWLYNFKLDFRFK